MSPGIAAPGTDGSGSSMTTSMGPQAPPALAPEYTPEVVQGLLLQIVPPGVVYAAVKVTMRRGDQLYLALANVYALNGLMDVLGLPGGLLRNPRYGDMYLQRLMSAGHPGCHAGHILEALGWNSIGSLNNKLKWMRTSLVLKGKQWMGERREYQTGYICDCERAKRPGSLADTMPMAHPQYKLYQKYKAIQYLWTRLELGLDGPKPPGTPDHTYEQGEGAMFEMSQNEFRDLGAALSPYLG